MSERTVRIGLIGFGAWGRCHAEAIRKTPGAELVAIAAHSETSCAAAMQAFPDVCVVSDYRELLTRPDIDLIDIVLPSHLHHEVAGATLAAGKHLLLEKPMCLSVQQCDDLINRAEKNHLKFAIGHELRLSSLWGQVKSLIDEGAIGIPQYVLVELSRKPYRQGSGGWRYDINRVGSWILEEPIHFFDLARWYLSSAGEPVSVFATANSRQPEHPELQDNFSAIVRFPGGRYAVISQSLAMFEHHQTVKISGTTGSLWASWSGALDRTRTATFSLKVSNGEAVREIPVARAAGELFELEDQLEMMVRAVRDDSCVCTSGTDGKWSVAMCLAAEQSVKSGCPVMMSEVI